MPVCLYACNYVPEDGLYIVASFNSVISFVNMCDNIFHSQLKHSKTVEARDTYKQYMQNLEARCRYDLAYDE